MPRLRHAWYDLPLRTILVCGLMAAVLEVSTWAGPILTGLLAVFPISSTSLILILQPRIGGRAAAAVLANSVWSLFGISFGLQRSILRWCRSARRLRSPRRWPFRSCGT